jgi:hypothetical protein
MLAKVLDSDGHAIDSSNPDDMDMRMLTFAFLGAVQGGHQNIISYTLNRYQYRSSQHLLFQQVIRQASLEDNTNLLVRLYENTPLPFADEEYACMIRYGGKMVGNRLLTTTKLGSAYFEDHKKIMLQACKVDNPDLIDKLQLTQYVEKELSSALFECFHKSQYYRLVSPKALLMIIDMYSDLSQQDYADILWLDKSRLGEDGLSLDEKMMESALQRFGWNFYTFIKGMPKANDVFSNIINPTKVLKGHETLNRSWQSLFSFVDDYMAQNLKKRYSPFTPEMTSAFQTLLSKLDIDSAHYMASVKKIKEAKLLEILKFSRSPEATKESALALLSKLNGNISSAQESRRLAKIGDLKKITRYLRKAKEGDSDEDDEKLMILLVQSCIGAIEGQRQEIVDFALKYNNGYPISGILLSRVFEAASIERNLDVLEYLHARHRSLFIYPIDISTVVKYADEQVAVFLLSSEIVKDEAELLKIATKIDNVDLVRTLYSVKDHKLVARYCFELAPTFQLRSPKVFSLIFESLPNLQNEDLIDVLRLSKSKISLHQKTKLEKAVMWCGFTKFGWEFYSFAHRNQEFNSTNSGLFPAGQIKLEYMKYVRYILNAFIEENLQALLELKSNSCLEDVLLESLKKFASEDQHLILDYQKHLPTISKGQMISGLIKAHDAVAQTDQVRASLGLPCKLESQAQRKTKERLRTEKTANLASYISSFLS